MRRGGQTDRVSHACPIGKPIARKSAVNRWVPVCTCSSRLLHRGPVAHTNSVLPPSTAACSKRHDFPVCLAGLVICSPRWCVFQYVAFVAFLLERSASRTRPSFAAPMSLPAAENLIKSSQHQLTRDLSYMCCALVGRLSLMSLLASAVLPCCLCATYFETNFQGCS